MEPVPALVPVAAPPSQGHRLEPVPALGVGRRPVEQASLFARPGSVFCSSCSTGPQPIQFGKDACDFCKMTILDQRFGGEVITKKGKVFKFDDLHCISSFLRSSNSRKTDLAGIYLLEYATPKKFVQANNSFLLQSNGLHSPMGGNTAAFVNEANRQQAKQQVNGTNVTWNDIIQ